MTDSLPLQLSPQQAFRRAVQIVGGQIKFAALCGRQQAAVSKRLAAGHEVWGDSVRRIEAATAAAGEIIPRWVLSPTLYPPEEYQTSTTGVGVAPPVVLGPTGGARLAEGQADLGAAA